MSDELPPLPSAYKWTGPSGQIEYDESATCSAAARAVGWRAEPLFTQAAIDAAVAEAYERCAALCDANAETKRAWYAKAESDDDRGAAEMAEWLASAIRAAKPTPRQ